MQNEPQEIINSVLFYAGPAFSIGLQASSVQTATKIVHDRTVGAISPVQFISLFTNSLVWLYYGLLLWDPVIIIPNAAGTLAGLFCIVAYEYAAVVRHVAIYLVAFLLIGAATSYTIQSNNTVVGYMGCIMSVVLMGSPLASVGTVIRDKNTASLPFTICIMNMFNGLAWTFYGYIIAEDPLVYAPSVIGSGLAAMQLSLFVLYGFPKAQRHHSIDHTHHHTSQYIHSSSNTNSNSNGSTTTTKSDGSLSPHRQHHRIHAGGSGAAASNDKESRSSGGNANDKASSTSSSSSSSSGISKVKMDKGSPMPTAAVRGEDFIAVTEPHRRARDIEQGIFARLVA